MILELCLRPIERRGIRETTKRALNIRSILAYAVASGRLIATRQQTFEAF